MAEQPKKWISKAISRPGRMKRRAAASGRSVREQMEHDSHSSDPSLRAAANLGLRLTGAKRWSKKKKKVA